MNSYLKLVHMEIHRFRTILGGLMLITALFQITALITNVRNELAIRKLPTYIPRTHGSYDDSLSFALIEFRMQRWFIIPMLLCIAVLAVYVLVIWYRDWVGRSSFIYRLLMLPTARFHIYLAKCTAMILFVFSLLSFQLLLLFIENMIFKIIVPADLRIDSFFSEIIASNRALKILLPSNFEQFIYLYGLGIIAVLVIFTAILIERCYARIGILYGLLYVAASFLVVMIPLLYFGTSGSSSYIYPGEILAVEAFLCGLVLIVSLLLGYRLINKKIAL